MGCVIPPDLNVRGARLGNPMWRSPEAHAAGRINLPSDVFSFGLVVSSSITPSLPSPPAKGGGLTKILQSAFTPCFGASFSASSTKRGQNYPRPRKNT
jgi:hypothetical protein